MQNSCLPRPARINPFPDPVWDNQGAQEKIDIIGNQAPDGSNHSRLRGITHVIGQKPPKQ
jgi:hypothetical protein